MSTENTDTRNTEFMLTIYNQITEETRRLRTEGLSRLNFFITITSSVLAGLIVLAQINTANPRNTQFFSVGALIFLILLGWNVFRFIVSRDISTDLNIRATGRINRYFSDRDPSIREYLTWQDHDEPTPWITNNMSNLRGTAQSILSSLVAVVSGASIFFITDNLIFALIGGVYMFVVALVSLQIYAQQRFKKATERARSQIRFPKIIIKQEENPTV